MVARMKSGRVDAKSEDQRTDFDEAHYRLSHDVLVPRLEAWLARQADDRGSQDEPTTDEQIVRTIDHEPASRRVGRSARANGPPGAGQPIDVNSATEDDLKTLPGIGQATARRMIEGRPYGTVDELPRVKGMSRMKLSEIRPFIILG